MKFDGQRYTTIEIDDPIVDPILERGDLKAQLCRGRLGAQLRFGQRVATATANALHRGVVAAPRRHHPGRGRFRVNTPARWPRTRGGRCRHTTRDATGAIPLGNRMSKTQYSKCTVIFKSNFKFCGPVCATGSVLGSPPDPAPSSAPASSPDPAPALVPRLPTPRLRLRPTDSSPGPRPTGGLF